MRSGGLNAITINGVPITGRLWDLGAGADGQPLQAAIEHYARGDDFVSVHPPSQSFPFRTQLVWSVETLDAAPRCVLLTLTLSLQTDLLDTRPAIVLSSDLARQSQPEYRKTAIGRWVGYGDLDSGATWCCYEMVHPLDQGETQIIEDDRPSLRIEPPFLEKGVIRSCRAAAAFFSGDPSEEELAAVRGAFIHAELPLTA